MMVIAATQQLLVCMIKLLTASNQLIEKQKSPGFYRDF